MKDFEIIKWKKGWRPSKLVNLKGYSVMELKQYKTKRRKKNGL